MSPVDRPIPPTGEEIHIPGPSAQPILLTLGITIALLGVTLGLIVLIPGLVLIVWVLVVWIRDAVREYQHLPLDHHAGHGVEVTDTVPGGASDAHAH